MIARRAEAEPRAGDLLLVGRAASVQFAGNAAILFRVIRVHDWTTYEGWRWLDGYVIGRDGQATDRRSIFVQVAGLVPASPQRRVAPQATPTRPQPPETSSNRVPSGGPGEQPNPGVTADSGSRPDA